MYDMCDQTARRQFLLLTAGLLAANASTTVVGAR